MPQLESRHLKRMTRDHFRFGMPDSVQFVRQVVVDSGRSPRERILFTRGTKRSPSLHHEIESFRALSRTTQAVNRDAGVISASKGELRVEGLPSEVDVRVSVPARDYDAQRETTTASVQRKVPEIPVSGVSAVRGRR